MFNSFDRREGFLSINPQINKKPACLVRYIQNPYPLKGVYSALGSLVMQQIKSLSLSKAKLIPCWLFSTRISISPSLHTNLMQIFLTSPKYSSLVCLRVYSRGCRRAMAIWQEAVIEAGQEDVLYLITPCQPRPKWQHLLV